MDEILLTRIFSVTLWYHFAFGAISLAMFGMTVGALEVYQHPEKYDSLHAKQQMARASLCFGVTAVCSVLTHLLVPFATHPLVAMLWIILSYVLLSIPFYFSGICVSLGVTKFPAKASLLYMADLVGAASGCILLIYTLKVTDAPTAVFVLALLGSLAAAVLAVDSGSPRLSRAAIITSAVLGIYVIVNSSFVANQSSPVRLTWAKGRAERRPLFEKWNSFSRIAVEGDPNIVTSVVNEGISPTVPETWGARQLSLRIDGDAATTITAFDGRIDEVEYLKYDVKNIVHHIRTGGNVLIIGAGGGRDVLAALSMGQKQILAVEINDDIIRAVTSRFGDFSGHLERNPRVTFVNDEARSYIARTKERFDVIEASFIDTWAATATGALTTVESSLYTVEAWRLFLDRLAPDGVLSVSRWYTAGLPVQAYRLTSLAAAALRSEGVTDPRNHILMVGNTRRGFVGAATILVARQPFSLADLDRFELICKRMQFNIVLSPRFAADHVFETLGNGKDPTEVSESLRLDVSPSTDNCPFFFDFVPLRYLFRSVKLGEGDSVEHQSGGFVIVLLLVVTFLTLFFVLVPLARTLDKTAVRLSVPYWLFFAAIGLGFMLIEVSQLQRLIIFLGHPTYALSVVLFTLLLSSGLGSMSTSRQVKPNWNTTGRLLLLWVSLLAYGLLTPRAIGAFGSATNPVRIGLATAVLFPVGFLMGMAFPLALKMSAGSFSALMPAFWGVNGGASICASILAMVIAMNAGISAAFWTGFWCYVIAFLAYCWAALSIAQ